MKTQRSYTEFLSKDNFDMYKDAYTHQLTLVNSKTNEICKKFACSAFTETTFKFLDKSEITVPIGSFIALTDSNPITHKKFNSIQKRFVKY